MPSPENRILVVSPQQIEIGTIDPPSREFASGIGILLDLDEEKSGLIGIKVAINLSPGEAREMAASLIRMANKTEEGKPRA